MKNRFGQLLSLAQGIEVNINPHGLNIRGHGVELWVSPGYGAGAVNINLRAPALGIASFEMNLGKTTPEPQGLTDGAYYYHSTITKEDGSQAKLYTNPPLATGTAIPGVTHPL